MTTTLPAGGITVILAVRDGRRYLPSAIESLHRQTLVPAEILAVVGTSADDTLDYLRAQPDIRVLEQDGTGLAAARNQGVEVAGCAWIAFLDHDDLWHPEKLATQWRSLSSAEGAVASVTHFRLVEDVDPDDPAHVSSRPGQPARPGWTPSALLAHRDVFRAVGPFDPSLGMGCDTDWFRRLRLADVAVAVATEVLLDKRIHAANLSRDTAVNRAAMFRMLAKHRTERRGEE